MERERAWLQKTLDKLNTGILDIGKNIPVFKNSFPYSADVKHTVNKNWFDFV